MPTVTARLVKGGHDRAAIVAMDWAPDASTVMVLRGQRAWKQQQPRTQYAHRPDLHPAPLTGADSKRPTEPTTQ